MTRDYTGFTEEQIKQLQNYEANYLREHGHRIENEKAKITCAICKEKAQRIWNGIVNVGV